MGELKQCLKPLHKLSPKLIRYAEIYATGLHSKTEAARQAGYSQKTADSQSFAWIGESRANSEYPFLYDHWEKINRKHLRKFEVNTENVMREIALLSFSDVTRYVDLPSREYENKKVKAFQINQAQNIDRNYKYWQEKMSENTKEGKTGPKFRQDPPAELTSAQVELLDWFNAMTYEEQSNVMIWQNYNAGSIRIKNREDIPKELLPAIAEINESREGIKVKLHDKLGALDKLARILKMYDENKEESPTNAVKEINIYVNGTKSTLMDDHSDTPAQ